MKIGLRVDVDTWRGTKQGVPNLCRLFKQHDIKSTFYFSVGPDNMGRHLWRLLKPAFLWKMLRTNAAGLYGPEIIFMGTMWPGLQIGKHLGKEIEQVAQDGHEIGFHAWDHHREQSKIEKLSAADVHCLLEKGVETLKHITGSAPVSSAVPGWRCTDATLLAKAQFPFKFNSDCRGESIFRPVVDGQPLEQLQIPVTLPTYDEILGRNGINNNNYNDHMLSLLKPDKLNVLTVHTEAEGGKCLAMFDDFLTRAKNQGWKFVPLGSLIDAPKNVPHGKIVPKSFPGREGWLGCQKNI